MLGEGETISSESTAQGKMTTHPRLFGQHNLILNDLKRTQRWVGIEEAWIWKELGEGDGYYQNTLYTTLKELIEQMRLLKAQGSNSKVHGYPVCCKCGYDR